MEDEARLPVQRAPAQLLCHSREESTFEFLFLLLLFLHSTHMEVNDLVKEGVVKEGLLTDVMVKECNLLKCGRYFFIRSEDS